MNAARVSRIRLTARARLAMLYGALTFVTGTVVTGLTYLLVRNGSPPPGPTIVVASSQSSGAASVVPLPPDEQLIAKGLVTRVSNVLLNQLLSYSLLSLGLLVILAFGVGWWMAGRALRPVHRMTASARRISASNLHERIALDGPADELKELADTFDALLGRLDAAFDSQRRFVANAAHELRTPLAINRATLQIELEESPEDAGKVIAVRDRLLAINRRSEHLIDGLLVLATSDRGLARRQPVALADLTASVIGDLEASAEERDLTIATEIDPLATVGDPVLLRHLIVNLVQNAIRHNIPGGQVTLRTGSQHGLTVTNTGPVVPADAVPVLFEPFRRLRTVRTGSDEGAGLGLSIVRSIVEAHDGLLHAHPNPGGGLTVRIAFPEPGTSTDMFRCQCEGAVGPE